MTATDCIERFRKDHKGHDAGQALNSNSAPRCTCTLSKVAHDATPVHSLLVSPSAPCTPVQATHVRTAAHSRLSTCQAVLQYEASREMCQSCQPARAGTDGGLSYDDADVITIVTGTWAGPSRERRQAHAAVLSIPWGWRG